jgi:hypothetical protein
MYEADFETTKDSGMYFNSFQATWTNAICI